MNKYHENICTSVCQTKSESYFHNSAHKCRHYLIKVQHSSHRYALVFLKLWNFLLFIHSFLFIIFYMFSYMTTKLEDILRTEQISLLGAETIQGTSFISQLPWVTLLKLTNSCSAMKSQGNIPHDRIHWEHKQQNTVSETEQQTMQMISICK